MRESIQAGFSSLFVLYDASLREGEGESSLNDLIKYLCRPLKWLTALLGIEMFHNKVNKILKSDVNTRPWEEIII